MAINKMAPYKLALAIGVVCVPIAQPSSAAEFVEFYKVGVAAADSGDWNRVAEMMQRSIERQPNAKARVSKSLYFKRYLPHFYLGQALYRTGDCAGALASWQESESQAVVKKFPEHELIREGVAACGQQNSELEFAMSQAKGLLANAGSSGIKAREGVAGLLLIDGNGAVALTERLNEADSVLRQAEVAFSTAQEDLQALERSASLAAEARDRFDSVDREASQWLNTLSAQRVQMNAELQRLVGAANQALEKSEFLRPFPPGIAKRRSRLVSLVEEANTLDPQTPSTEVDDLVSRLNRSTVALRQAAQEPPPELSAAAGAYLQGDYLQVLEILGQESRNTDKEAAQAHLLQAAAFFALFHTQGASHPELLEQARQEVLACRTDEKSVPSPSPSVFSPSFIEFFAEQTPILPEDIKDTGP